jgi:hypothetical protein
MQRQFKGAGGKEAFFINRAAVEEGQVLRVLVAGECAGIRIESLDEIVLAVVRLPSNDLAFEQRNKLGVACLLSQRLVIQIGLHGHWIVALALGSRALLDFAQHRSQLVQ